MKNSKKKILIVEDDEEMREAYDELLGQVYAITQVDTTRKAKNKLSKEKYDLMILDVVLPGESGDAFFANIRNDKKYDALKVIVVTVLGDMTDQFKKIDPDVVCIAKPFDKKKFLRKIEKAL